MALKVIWTTTARNGLAKVIEYLEQNWTHREIVRLDKSITSTLLTIISNPEIFPKSLRFKATYKALVDKNNYLIYRVNMEKEIIEIINFRGTKQRPKH